MIRNMKKKLFVLIVLLLFTSCKRQTDTNINNNPNINNDQNILENSKIEEYTDNNPIVLGIYQYHQNIDRELLTDYQTNWASQTDIGSFEIFFTNDPTLPSSSFKDLWYTYYNNYQNVEGYKIGYNIKFTINNDTNINQNILSPDDSKTFFDYLQIYLYDDIHQENNTWYSHMTQEEYNENVMLTSIKLTNSDYTNQITSDILLTAFTYKQSDFDENNNYRGHSKYTITIKNT